MNWDTCVKSYLQITQDGCPEDWRPTWCKACQAEAAFHRHGSFLRSLLTSTETYEIRIFRFKCTTCSKTVSLFPLFLRPNHTAALDVQENVVRCVEDGHSLASIAETSRHGHTEKTLWRWRKHWTALLNSVIEHVWEKALARTPHLPLPKGKARPSTNWGWIFYLWGWVGSYWTDKPIGCLQWLMHLAQSLAVAV